MRLAVLSDIHGNLDALQAVLADLQTVGGADHTWILGDLAAFGPNPAECIQTVMNIPDAKVIAGNTDRYLITGDRPRMFKAEEASWGRFAAKTQDRDRAFVWALERLGWAEAEFLQKLGTDLALEIEGYGWAVGFHAVPGDDEGIITPQTPDSDILDALLDREGRLAFGGHTHIPMNRDLGHWRMVNPGSVGLPFDGDTRAAYALVTFEDGDATVDIRRVAYDVEAVIAKLAAGDYPSFDLMARRLRQAGS